MSARGINKGKYLLGALWIGALAVSVTYALPAISALDHAGLVGHVSAAGASVHAKNSPTPRWIVELQTRQAHQRPLTVQNGTPGYWI